MDYQYIPFYMQGNPIGGIYAPPIEDRDLEYVKEMYPQTFSKIQEQVDRECDKQEFAGSMMFDEYPDKLTLYRIANRIFDNVKEEEKNCRKNCIQYPDNQWLKDIIIVLLLNEMFRRRRKRRKRGAGIVSPRW